MYNDGSFQRQAVTRVIVSCDTWRHNVLGAGPEWGGETAPGWEASLYQSLAKEARKRNEDD